MEISERGWWIGETPCAHPHHQISGKELWEDGAEPGGASSPENSPDEFIFFKKQMALNCLWSCAVCFCAVMLIALMVFTYVGWSLVSLSKQSYYAQDPHITPAEFPRYSSCGGCQEGNKTDEELRECVRPCYNLSFVLDWERFSERYGYTLVYFPSRPGPRGEPRANISAWWLPAPPRGGLPAPRVVVVHGLGANSNHCGVQSACFLLRAMGFSCLTPSLRDHGLSGPSDHPDILSWGYDYFEDILGGWDYAVEDPDGVLGGPISTNKVGLMGFSKGALESAIAFGVEGRIPGAWLDSGPYGGLYGMIVESVAPYVGHHLGKYVANVVFHAARHFSGHRVDVFDPLKVMANCTPLEAEGGGTKTKRRQVTISHSSLDQVVPVKYAGMAVAMLSGLAGCYEVHTFTPPEYCNGDTHHQEMWEFPDDTRQKLCSFWSKTFGQDEQLCGLDKLPDFQHWSPRGKLPPNSPELPWRL